MNKKVLLHLFSLAVAISIVSLHWCVAQPEAPQFLWTNTMAVNDVAVSGNGNYIAAVNDTGLYYFVSTSSIPLWWWLTAADYPVAAVAISSDGEYVAVGTSNVGYVHYFNNSRSRVNLQSDTWESEQVGSVDRETFDMSDNGDYIAVGGSGESLYYFASCRTRSGSPQTSTWTNSLSGLIESVDMSADGRYVALGGTETGDGGGGFVAFYKDAYSFPYPTEPLWWSDDVWSFPVLGVTLSDDGFAVAAVTASSSIHYWRNATTLTGDPSADWTEGVSLLRVDASANGDRVVAFSGQIGTLYYWGNARQRIDGTHDWAQLESEAVHDAAISDDGSIIAALTENASGYWAYFYTYEGNVLGNPFQLDALSDKISMSTDGTTVALGGAPRETDSLCVFKITTAFPVGGEIQPPNVFDLIANQAKQAAPYLLASAFAVATLMAVVAGRKNH
jgi:WD40 repeat protein